ncbi:unnamed protein product [Cyclocybe aegerita]|uniref:Cytochrome P450 n=1 Tax=Cyclocybe aegerita TaxID=1973307 RepID=A0A8S0Y0A8_CYCAE|nr:unnamed protein product [Cyclocybe aegerita]
MFDTTVLGSWSVILSAGVVVLTGLVLSQRRGNLPPGPRGLPIIGNLLNVPLKHPWRVYARWAQKYQSDILSLRIPGATLIILNKGSIVNDLFSKRALIYSDRPQSTLFEMMGVSRLIVFQNYGEKWKSYRRTFKHDFEAETNSASRSHELAASRRLLRRLLKTKNHEKELRLTAGDAILSVTYGLSPSGEDDSYVALADETMTLLADVGRGGFIVDALPILKLLPSWFPGAGFKDKVARGAKLVDTAIRTPFETVKAEMATGNFKSSVASRYLASLDDFTNTPDKLVDDMRNVLGIAYLGGADTTVAQLCSFTLAMLLYPEVQKKAQKELDAVLHGRFPDFGDYGKIPYIEAIVHEVLRWNPMTPLGVFHVLNQDDSYEGYVFPKGSICVANVWAILHDEELYGPKPDEFIPERFLNKDGTINPKRADTDAAFGFGRRICPGRVIAREFVWIAVAHLLTAYDIVDGTDKDGKPLDRAKIEYTSEMISFAPHVNCTFRLRPGVTEGMIHDAIEAL